MNTVKEQINNSYYKIVNSIALIFTLSLLIGCQSSSYNDDELSPKNKSHIYSNLIKKKGPAISKNEYVSRIGKKILLVSYNPEASITFNVDGSSNEVSIGGSSVNVSSNVLQTLDDEASLAYVLAAGIEKINNKGYKSEFEEDKDIIHNLERAGYDPKVIVELQSKYLDLPGKSNYNWVKSLSDYKIDSKRISNNKNYISKGFKGLKKYRDRYINIIKL